MKTRNAKARGSVMLTSTAILLVAGTIFFSCKKNSDMAAVPGYDNMDNIAKMLDGNAELGCIATASDDGGTEMVFNKGSKYVLIEKIPGTPGADVNAIESAVLITS